MVLAPGSCAPCLAFRTTCACTEASYLVGRKTEVPVALQFVGWAGEAEAAVQAIVAEMQALGLFRVGTA